MFFLKHGVFTYFTYFDGGPCCVLRRGAVAANVRNGQDAVSETGRGRQGTVPAAEGRAYAAADARAGVVCTGAAGIIAGVPLRQRRYMQYAHIGPTVARPSSYHLTRH